MKMKDPTREEMLEFLAPLASQIGADNFDIEAAIWWFACDNHGGQWSNLYSALSTSPFSPSPLHYSVDQEGEVALLLYLSLVEEFTYKPSKP